MSTPASARRTDVSVIVPCFNGERYLGEALESALAQTHPPLEVIVVDDGSTDASAAVAASFGKAVRVVRQANQGESVARNRGFELGRGEWLAFLDADDIWHPDKLASEVALAEPDVVCIHTGYYKFGTASGEVDRSSLDAAERYRPRYVALHNFLLPSTALVRRSVRTRFPTWTQHGEDLFFFLELLGEGEFRAVSGALTGHRCHAGAQSAATHRDLRWWTSVRSWLDRDEHGLDAEEAHAIRSGWDRRVARAALGGLWEGRVEEWRSVVEALGGVGAFGQALVRAVAEDVWWMPARTVAAWRRGESGSR